MPMVALLLACLVYSGRAGRMDPSGRRAEKGQGTGLGTAGQSERLAMLFMAFINSEVGWQSTRQGRNLTPARWSGSNRILPTAVAMASDDVHKRVASPPVVKRGRADIERRDLLAALAAAAAAIQLPRAGLAAGVPSVRGGMEVFRNGQVEESIEIFDTLIKLNPNSKPYLWQRGLSLYYADRFQDGAEQFATDVAVNPNDTEESIWNLLCVARLEGIDAARKKILKVGFDRRPVMRAAQDLFAGTTDESKLKEFAAGKGNNEFYGNLYLGLYREVLGDATGARQYLTAATKCQYGKESGDYMADLAKVHVQRRGW